jgi:hypothetical protein
VTCIGLVREQKQEVAAAVDVNATWVWRAPHPPHVTLTDGLAFRARYPTRSLAARSIH